VNCLAAQTDAPDEFWVRPPGQLRAFESVADLAKISIRRGPFSDQRERDAVSCNCRDIPTVCSTRRNQGKTEGSMQAFIVATVLGAVAGVITADHFKGPMFHDVAYCLNDGGAQKTRMCTGRVPP
jgi:hypothetical protein